MTSVKLLMSALVGERNYLEGDTVLVPDDRARHMIAAGVAEDAGQGAEGDSAPAGQGNADFNPLGDVLTPLPHTAIPINPVDAISPHVGDHPGLNKLVETVGVKDEQSPAGRASTIQPVPTRDVASQEQIDQSHREADPARAGKGKAAKPASGDLTTDSLGPAVVVPVTAKEGPAKAETAALAGAPAVAATKTGAAK